MGAGNVRTLGTAPALAWHVEAQADLGKTMEKLGLDLAERQHLRGVVREIAECERPDIDSAATTQAILHRGVRWLRIKEHGGVLKGKSVRIHVFVDSTRVPRTLFVAHVSLKKVDGAETLVVKDRVARRIRTYMEHPSRHVAANTRGSGR